MINFLFHLFKSDTSVETPLEKPLEKAVEKATQTETVEAIETNDAAPPVVREEKPDVQFVIRRFSPLQLRLPCNAVFIGDRGAGKSTTIKHLISQWGPDVRVEDLTTENLQDECSITSPTPDMGTIM